ncbi:hypothetical protein [Lysobacter enzymogenes]|uniref:hypothetical protein n=1 Tax=Lysobacter enzymogenes TaxID=69 RepID=UPI00099C347F|nr:hypothetical protein [Lysobacter enzymogenes]UZW62726.1 hypothetical protein BV903_010725 [Lysobacter enzymogenes]
MNYVSPFITVVQEKRSEAESLSADVAAFKAKGGQVQQLLPGDTAATVAEREAQLRKQHRRRRNTATGPSDAAGARRR